MAVTSDDKESTSPWLFVGDGLLRVGGAVLRVISFAWRTSTSAFRIRSSVIFLTI